MDTMLAQDGMKHCSVCGEHCRRVSHGKCKSCHAAYMRENRKPYSALEAEEKIRANTRSYTSMLIKRGELIRPDVCENCDGKGFIEAHHPNYRRPRLVEWLCRPCHQAHHKRINEVKRFLNGESP